MSPRQLAERIGERVREWNITVETTLVAMSLRRTVMEETGA